MSPADHALADLVRQLDSQDVAVPASELRREPTLPDEPGIYAWWANPSGLALLSEPLGAPLSPLIYAGQAGAASSRARKTGAATLRSRILVNHLRGNIRSSTFRLTLCAVLCGPLALRLTDSGRLERGSNAALSAWMDAHLRLTWVALPDRSTLGAIEEAVLRVLDPPLNLQGVEATPIRLRLRQLRANLASRSSGGQQPL